MIFKNSAGKIYYGMHFYPGVAEYREEGKEPYRVFINENTIRKMSPSFAGRPAYVQHVDEVLTQDGALTDRDADGYVVESFYNSADGKTWLKFMVVTEAGEAAIRRGWKLSNAYVPKQFGPGATWNGMDYDQEIVEAEYEHLAIVPNPRYEESVIMTPEEFKAYNAKHEAELKRIANSKETKPKENSKMGFSIFKKTKVENSKDLEGTIVELPKSKKHVEFEKLVNDADEMAMNADKPVMANGEHMVNVDGKEMSLNDLLALHKENSEKLAAMDKPENAEEDEEAKKKALELAENEEDEVVEDKDPAMENEDDEEKKKKDEEVKKNAADAAAKKAKADANFKALKNAPSNPAPEMTVVELMSDRVARGKAKYGSG